MARWLGIVALCGVLGACGASSATPRAGQARTAKPQCGQRGARTLARDRFVRVYDTGGVVYGCSKSRSYRLGSYQHGRPGGVSVGLIRVAGRVVANSTRAQGVDTASESVSVRRLTDGKRLHQDRATVGAVGPESFQSVHSLVVTRDGAVAWIGAASSIGGPHHVVQVLRDDRRGPKLLDSGAAVALKSLRLRRSTLRWKHGGVTRRATLR